MNEPLLSHLIYLIKLFKENSSIFDWDKFNIDTCCNFKDESVLIHVPCLDNANIRTIYNNTVTFSIDVETLINITKSTVFNHLTCKIDWLATASTGVFIEVGLKDIGMIALENI